MILSDLEVIFLGYIGESYQKEITKRGLTPIVNIKEYIPREECMQMMTKASILLLTISKDMKGQGIFTSKIFDYIISRKPILAIVPDDIAANLIKDTGAGIVVDPGDKENIVNAILTYYRKYKNGTLTSNKNPLPVEYSRLFLTQRLTAILNEINTD